MGGLMNVPTESLSGRRGEVDREGGQGRWTMSKSRGTWKAAEYDGGC